MMAMMPGTMNRPPAIIPPSVAVHQPADVSGKLLRLGSREQHAVVERVQESLLRYPALFLDEDAVHDSNLPGRSTKAQRRNPQPRPEGLAQCHAVARKVRGPWRSAGYGYVHLRLQAC